MNRHSGIRACLAACILISVALGDGAIALRADRMLDVTSGEMRYNATILVEGNSIKEINPETLAPGTKIVALGDVTLLPGLMDMHTHLTMELDEKMFMRTVTDGPADEALRGATMRGLRCWRDLRP